MLILRNCHFRLVFCVILKLELLSFEEKLEHIFKEYGDDYGAAEQILDYMQKNRNATEEYNIQHLRSRLERMLKSVLITLLKIWS